MNPRIPDPPADEQGPESDPQFVASPIEDAIHLSGSLFASEATLTFLEVREREGRLPTPTALTDFLARILREITKEDGATKTKFLDIEVRRRANGRVVTRRATILAADFANMQWLIPTFGPEWVVFAGGPTRDKVRQCIQQYSARMGIQHIKVFQSSGIETDEIGRFYVMKSGGITGDGLRTDIETDFEGSLAAIDLPAPERGDGLREAALAELRILDVAPESVSGPLFAAQPLAICSAFAPVDVVLMPYGRTGSGKSVLTAIIASRGGRYTSHNLVSATGTAAAIGLLSFRFNNSILPLDDFNPDGDAVQQGRHQGVIQAVIRQGGNVSGKPRMRRDGTLQQEYYARGVILLNGEDLPRGHSINGRLYGIEIGPGMIDWAVVSELQDASERGDLRRISSSIISWMLRNWDAVRETYLEQVRIHEKRFRTLPLAHPRHSHAMAMLLAASGIWLDGLVELDAITKAEADAAWERVSRGIEITGLAQSEAVRAVDPVEQFLRLVGAAIGAGDAHLCDPEDNGPPTNATVLGWTMQMLRTRDGLEPDFRTRGPRLGWIDDRGVFLLPDAALDAAQRLGRSQGISIPWASKTLGKRLAEGGHLLSMESGRNTQKIRVGGSFQRVWHLPTAAIVDIAAPNDETQTVLTFDRRKESA